MIRLARSRPLLALALVALVVGALFAARPAAAHEDEVIGWTVEQDGRFHHYPLDDKWQLELNAYGITLQQGGAHVVHHYYGTFHVVERRK